MGNADHRAEVEEVLWHLVIGVDAEVFNSAQQLRDKKGAALPKRKNRRTTCASPMGLFPISRAGCKGGNWEERGNRAVKGPSSTSSQGRS